MDKKKRSRKVDPVRFYAARADAKVGSIARRIENDYRLPEGSVALLLPSGKKARTDKLIRKLLDDWDWWE